MPLLLPKTLFPLDFLKPIPSFIYLGGPIRGGADWQAEAIDQLMAAMPDCVICCPSRYTQEHRHYRHRVSGDETYFDRQTDWEDHYMKMAALGQFSGERSGCLLFWLPREDAAHPRPKSLGPYAQDTYGELGYWRAIIESQCHKSRGPRIVLGIEHGFHGFKKLYRDFNRVASGNFPIHTTLRETVEHAIRVAA